MSTSGRYPNCPFCGGASYAAVRLPNHHIIACRKCQIARTAPSPANIVYHDQDFHGSFPYHSLKDLPAAWRRGLEMQRKMLLRHGSTRDHRVLEIGCGQGLLLRLLDDAGFRVCGIEPSRTASRVVHDAGLDVVEGYFSAASFPTDRFDIVVASHVLEHMGNPSEFIDEVSTVSPGGLLLLVQANWRGWVPRKTKSLWHAWAEGHHFWHFTASGLRRWLETKGCSLIACEYSSLEHGNYWLARLARCFPGASDQFHLLVRLPIP